MVGLGGSDLFCHTIAHRGLPYRVMNNIGGVMWVSPESPFGGDSESSVPKLVHFLIRQ
jgi:hypothetical protein